MNKVLFTGNVRLFLNTIPHVQGSIFPDPCHGISSVNFIRHVVASDTMKKFREPNSSHKIDFIKEGCSFLINIIFYVLI